MHTRGDIKEKEEKLMIFDFCLFMFFSQKFGKEEIQIKSKKKIFSSKRVLAVLCKAPN